MSKEETEAQAVEEDDDEPDEWYRNHKLQLQACLALTQQLAGTRESSLQVVPVCFSPPIVSRQIGDDHNTEEQLKMNDCYFEKKDWRACKKDVSCWALNPNVPSDSALQVRFPDDER